MTRQELAAFIIRNRLDFDREDNPFASSQWLLHWLANCAEEDWQFHTLGNLIVYAKPEAPNRWEALSNYYTSLFSPLVGDVLSPDAATVNLRPLAHTERVRFSRSWYVKRYACFGNYYLDCEKLTYGRYLEQRPSQLRNTLTRKGKQFKGQLEIVTEWDERAVQAYEEIYAQSWKQPEPYPQFVPGWMKVCAENGWLRLGIAWLEGVPIAAQFWWVRDGVASIFKLAYREDYAKMSAGSLLSACLFEHVIDRDDVYEVDYLTGDDAYKRAWMESRRERVGLLACNLLSLSGARQAGIEMAGTAYQRIKALKPQREITGYSSVRPAA